MNVDVIQPLIPDLKEVGFQILVTKEAALAFFTIQVYDHILTLPDEIELIWSGKFTLVTFLFFMNRYYAFAFFCIYMAALFSPLFTPSVCERFALFLPFAGGMPLTFTPDAVLALRVYGLYHRNKFVARLLAGYLVAELGVGLWIYCTPGSHPLILPQPFQHDNTFHICIEGVADSLGNLRPAAFPMMQAVYDTGIFLSIIFKVIQARRHPNDGQDLLYLFAKHGVTYYAVLFSSYATWTLMVLFAPTGLKYTAAVPTLIMACTMVNRITLSLRRFGAPEQESGSVNMLRWYAHSSEVSTEGRNGCTTDLDASIAGFNRGDAEAIELTGLAVGDI